MILLTGGGSFAQTYLDQFEGEVASIRELSQANFLGKLSQSSVVIHNVATINSDNLEQLIERNFDFTRFIVQKLQELNPKAHLILLSSMSFLDPNDDQKYSDVQEMTSYAYSKYLAETYTLKCGLEHVSSVRFSTLFYKDPQKDGLSKLISDTVSQGRIILYNNGEASRNFLPIETAAAYVQKITEQEAKGKRTYTLAAPSATSFAAVADILRQYIPNLTIENKDFTGNSTSVLADFSSESIDELGTINFSLDEEIKKYLRRLQR